MKSELGAILDEALEENFEALDRCGQDESEVQQAHIDRAQDFYTNPQTAEEWREQARLYRGLLALAILGAAICARRAAGAERNER